MPDRASRLRRDAVEAFTAAVEAVRPEQLVDRTVGRAGGRIEVLGEPLPAPPGRRVVAALGKAAPGLAGAWLEAVGDWTSETFVLVPHGVSVPEELERRATVRRGAHPYPDSAGEAAARELLALASGLGPNDLLLVLLSGGASALLAAPADGLALDDVRTTTRELLRAGAPIRAVNTVRRELLAAGGGGLAAAAYPARVETLVLSDVLGDPLPDIASGPTVPSPTTAADALAVLARYGLIHRVPQAVVRFLERRLQRPHGGEPSWAATSRARILANNRTAVTAAARALAARGYAVWRADHPLTGEAALRGRQLGALMLASETGEPTAGVLGGETTVTVRGDGRGGRNQELALAAALALEGGPPRVLLAAGTDGVDGLTDAAGAVVDAGTAARIRAAGIDPETALARNDSGTALAAAGDALVTGPTGTNVCDLVLLLV